MPKKRKLTPKELRLVVHVRGLRKDGRIRKGATLHVARATAKGNIIRACNKTEVDLLGTYYFPFLLFIVEDVPMCNDCLAMLEDEGLLTPVSNTGVNSKELEN